ncbi:DUF6942 family protein [Alkalimarinus coralli]|uniref:DUF6942 family protein n=1 Tax=Alkalimarinus coralli TaxID=2935863 RepID=UPI00202AF087|nr:hypothetical protein [Alkalimarinus coralli]
MANNITGLGDHHYRLAVCIGNRPDLPEYQQLTGLKALKPGDISYIVDRTGNHWRKIFNIFAKLMFQLDDGPVATWQAYRDQQLLQKGCGHTLIFPPIDHLPCSVNTACIVSGKSYAEQFGLLERAAPLGEGFYIDISRKTIVTPYFDYRQLSNRKLDMLISIIQRDLKI